MRRLCNIIMNSSRGPYRVPTLKLFRGLVFRVMEKWDYCVRRILALSLLTRILVCETVSSRGVAANLVFAWWVSCFSGCGGYFATLATTKKDHRQSLHSPKQSVILIDRTPFPRKMQEGVSVCALSTRSKIRGKQHFLGF